jgi:GTP-binding protein EngB required for normal cell division
MKKMSTEERSVGLSSVQTQELIDKLSLALDRAKQHGLKIVAVGRTGVGKSSTINALLGSDVAPVGHFEPATASVEQYTVNLNGIPCVLADTPGLCDKIVIDGESSGYLKEMAEALREVDLLLFVTQLDFNRVDGCEMLTIRDITKILGAGVWSHSLIVFTHACKVPVDKYKETVAVRTGLIRQEIARHAPGVDAVPAIAIDTTSATSPDGTTWLPELYMAVVRRLRQEGIVPYIFAAGKDPKMLHQEDVDYIKDRIPEEEGSGLLDAFQFLYMTVGPGLFLGSVIGGPVGGAIGAALGPAGLVAIALISKFKSDK